MRNIKVVIEYDGTDFLGWQVQREGRTVQAVIHGAIEQLFRNSAKIYAAGRTDTGVHALGQVANFRIESSLDEFTICKGLNACLPQDVRIRIAEEVNPSFNARFDAVSREYRYVISKQPKAVGRQYAWFCKYQLDVTNIKEASAFLLGKHKFKDFAKHNENEKHYLCQVEQIDWFENEKIISMEIRANRFLHNMVRIIVGTMVEVGRGKMLPSAVADILEGKNQSLAASRAPAHGLFLLKVNY